jgi:uncharacterized RDD family membrane protein YckC
MQVDNPYAPPLEAGFQQPEFAEKPRDPASPTTQGKRFIHLIVDRIATTALSYGVGAVFGFVYGSLRVDPTLPLSADELTRLNIAGYALGVVVVMSYFIFLEVLFQRTLGKLLTGTIVIAADGGPPTLGQIVGRNFARLIPFDAFSFLGCNNPVGWHDSLSGTRVVDVK